MNFMKRLAHESGVLWQTQTATTKCMSYTSIETEIAAICHSIESTVILVVYAFCVIYYIIYEIYTLYKFDFIDCQVFYVQSYKGKLLSLPYCIAH